jgi:hypothetical protein
MDEKTAVERLQRQYERQNKYIKEKYDRIVMTMPKGSKDRIKASLEPGESINAFISGLIEKELKKREKKGV